MTGSEFPRLDAATARSALIRDALETAQVSHADQIRNGSGGMPYIEHPMAVAELLAEHGVEDEEVLAAALLHDVVEDSYVTVADLRQRFGERPAALVEALSDDESIEPYRERKDEHRGRVAAAAGDALAIYGADKLTNIGTLRRTYAIQGEAVAAEFKVPLDLKMAVWEADLELLERLAPQLPFLAELEAQLNGLRADRRAAGPLPRT
ncbi:MAG TPA: HD domain-containing protein [Solirubrobacterales bacterium]|jgi:(p)ppGpp synthase/HD superfamily hydrolase|nr:HD domain-containing protein [Solirubrobacterales bacterium]